MHCGVADDKGRWRPVRSGSHGATAVVCADTVALPTLCRPLNPPGVALPSAVSIALGNDD